MYVPEYVITQVTESKMHCSEELANQGACARFGTYYLCKVTNGTSLRLRSDFLEEVVDAM
jgi:hypothetical protein